MSRPRKQHVMRWVVHNFAPQSNGLPTVTLEVETRDPEVVNAVESAAHVHGFALERLDVEAHRRGEKSD